ncbi:MAG: hypothetical protein ACTSQS_14510 [Promethearchaeota archaeon]
MNIIEETFNRDFIIWIDSDSLTEKGILNNINIISAWKSKIDDIKIILGRIINQYGDKFVAITICNEKEKITKINNLFKKIDEKLKKISISEKRYMEDIKTIQFVRKNKFILNFIGLSGTSGFFLFFLLQIKSSLKGFLGFLVDYLISIFILVYFSLSFGILLILIIRFFRIICHKIR